MQWTQLAHCRNFFCFFAMLQPVTSINVATVDINICTYICVCLRQLIQYGQCLRTCLVVVVIGWIVYKKQCVGVNSLHPFCLINCSQHTAATASACSAIVVSVLQCFSCWKFVSVYFSTLGKIYWEVYWKL